MATVSSTDSPLAFVGGKVVTQKEATKSLSFAPQQATTTATMAGSAIRKAASTPAPAPLSMPSQNGSAIRRASNQPASTTPDWNFPAPPTPAPTGGGTPVRIIPPAKVTNEMKPFMPSIGGGRTASNTPTVSVPKIIAPLKTLVEAPKLILQAITGEKKTEDAAPTFDMTFGGGKTDGGSSSSGGGGGGGGGGGTGGSYGIPKGNLTVDKDAAAAGEGYYIAPADLAAELDRLVAEGRAALAAGDAAALGAIVGAIEDTLALVDAMVAAGDEIPSLLSTAVDGARAFLSLLNEEAIVAGKSWLPWLLIAAAGVGIYLYTRKR